MSRPSRDVHLATSPYFTRPSSVSRRMLPRMPPELPRRPPPKIAFEASRTAMVVAMRTADFAIVSPSESLRLVGVFGMNDDGAGCASRRRGRGFGAGSAGGAGGVAAPRSGRRSRRRRHVVILSTAFGRNVPAAVLTGGGGSRRWRRAPGSF
jgi:hypothetical protein